MVVARTNQPKGIQAIGIGFRILDCLAAARKPMALGAIAKAIGMTPSKVRFYLVSFMQLGLVTQDPLSAHYNLGPGAIRLGLSALEQFDVITASKRSLHELVDRLGFSAFLAVWGSHGPTVVHRVDGPSKTVLEVRVGTVLPLLNSAIGRAFLTYMPQSVTKTQLQHEIKMSKRNGFPNETADQIVEATRARGVSVACGTLLAGFTAIAAPVMDRAALPAAAISVIGPIGSLDDTATGKPARLLKAVTAELSTQIGGSDALLSKARSVPARAAGTAA